MSGLTLKYPGCCSCSLLWMVYLLVLIFRGQSLKSPNPDEYISISAVDRGRGVSTGWFFWLFRPKKWLSVRLHCKSHQKSSKCQIFQWVWHLFIFRAEQSKKPPCICTIFGSHKFNRLMGSSVTYQFHCFKITMHTAGVNIILNPLSPGCSLNKVCSWVESQL